MSLFKNITECVCCGSTDLIKFIDLNEQPLANNLVCTKEQEYVTLPLEVNACKSCWHSQLSISVEPEVLFKDYFYVTGTTKTMNDYCENLSGKLTKQFSRKDKKVLDIACNDGTLLEKFRKNGWQVFGVEPACNLVKILEEKKIPVENKFFGNEKIDFATTFDLITALNVFAHVPSPLQFLIDASELLSDNGTILVQTSQRNMVDKKQFDTVYHEHISFFSVNSMKVLVERAGLFLNKIETSEIHGDSYVFYIQKIDNPDRSVEKLLEQERESGRYSLNTYLKFQSEIEYTKSKFLQKIKGKKLIGFGAAAKGIVLLNFLKLKLDYIIDENKLKQNKFLPNLGSKIVPLKALDEQEEDTVVFILPWNFEKEIKNKLNNKFSTITYFGEQNGN